MNNTNIFKYSHLELLHQVPVLPSYRDQLTDLLIYWFLYGGNTRT